MTELVEVVDAPVKRKNGPRHVPTDETRKQVAQYAAVGVTREQLCKSLNIASDTFTKYYGDLFDRSKVQAIALVAGSLFKKATEKGGDTASAIFYLKTQARWRETDQVQPSGVFNIHVHVNPQ